MPLPHRGEATHSKADTAPRPWLPFSVLITLSTLVLLSAACRGATGSPNTPVTAQDLTVRIGVPQVVGLGGDPVRGLLQLSTALTTEGLVFTQPDGRTVGRLADTWEKSADGLVWTFHLRPGARFHDGTPVDAIAVKRSLEKSLSNPAALAFQPGLRDIATVEAAGPHSVAIRLKEKSTFFLEDLIVPITKEAEDPSLQAIGLGTGPYRVSETAADRIHMTAFGDGSTAKVPVQELEWQAYPTLRTAWAAMMRNEIDFLADVGQDAVEFVRSEASVQTFTFPSLFVSGIIFNSSIDGLKDPAVREALNYAIDRPRIIADALRGQGTPAHSVIWPEHWAYDKDRPGYSYDPGRADATLRAQAHRNPGRRADGPLLQFTCLVPSDFATWERMALMVQRQLLDVGIDMQLEMVPLSALNQRIGQGDFEAVFLEMVGSRTMSVLYAFWHSSSPQNAFRYSSPAVDAALDAVRRADDDGAYKLAVSRLQEAMLADPPAIWLAWGQTTQAVTRRFVVPETGTGDLYTSLSRWRLASPDEQASTQLARNGVSP